MEKFYGLKSVVKSLWRREALDFEEYMLCISKDQRRSTVQTKVKKQLGNSLGVQWLGLHASTAGGAGLIPGWGTKILHAMRHSRKKRKKKKKTISEHVRE